jgi:hypothetical protein
MRMSIRYFSQQKSCECGIQAAEPASLSPAHNQILHGKLCIGVGGGRLRCHDVIF